MALEAKKFSLANELQALKGSMYDIMGDLYTANKNARGSPAAGPAAGSKVIESLDPAKMEVLTDLLALSRDEMAEIFSNEESLERSDAEADEEKDRFQTTLERALDLSGESSVDVASISQLGQELVRRLQSPAEI